jgi:hypothetical protein
VGLARTNAARTNAARTNAARTNAARPGAGKEDARSGRAARQILSCASLHELVKRPKKLDNQDFTY